MVQCIKVRRSQGSIPKSLLSPLSTSRTSTVVWAEDRVGLKASVIYTGKQGTASWEESCQMRT